MSKNPINVLHLSNTEITSDSRIIKQVKAVGDLEDCNVYAFGVTASDRNEQTRISNTNIIGIFLYSRIFRLMPRAIRYFFEMIEFTTRALQFALKLKPALIHCHDTFVLPSGWLCKIFLGCKLVYDAHELESDKNGQSIILSKVTLAIEKICWSKIDLLISVSDSINTWYVSNFGVKEYILVLNSPEIGLAPSHVSKRYFHEQYGIPEGQLVFVYLGILGSGRGIEVSLDAFTELSEKAHVVFVGDGPLSLHIEKYCEKYPNIHLHKPVPHQQVVSLVNSADIGLCFVENVSLSDYYCLPNKLFEYCFAGLPVLASDFPEIKKLVDQYSLGVCCSPDAGSVRDAISSVVKHPPKRIESDLSGLSWSAQADRLKSSYSRLLNAK